MSLSYLHYKERKNYLTSYLVKVRFMCKGGIFARVIDKSFKRQV
jgi:hypothetical protein